MSPRNQRKRKRTRGNGTIIKEFQAIQEDVLRQEKKGGEYQEGLKAQPQQTLASVTSHFSPKLAELKIPYFATNNVRYLGICGLCDFPLTDQGRCMNLDCRQEWGDPKKLTDELVSAMIARAKALQH